MPSFCFGAGWALFLCFSFSWILSSCTSLPQPSADFSNNKVSKTKVLLIGNSFVMGIADLFENLTQEHPSHWEVSQYIRKGTPLFQHSKDVVLLERIKKEHWDYVILVPRNRMILKKAEKEMGAIKALARQIRIRGAIPVLMFNWNRRDRPQNYEPILKFTAQASEALGITILPAGELWRQLGARGIPLYIDGVHPNALGKYAAAYMMYLTLIRPRSDRLDTSQDIKWTKEQILKRREQRALASWLSEEKLAEIRELAQGLLF